jgi:very-short-patch-repair endonuclease
MDKHRARELRRNLTDAEKALWRHLRLRQLGGFKFRRQQVIGKYIVDFICLEKRLILEVDGGQHLEQMTYDSKREDWLKSQGFRILRFWDNAVLEETQAVMEAINEALVVPPPQSSPARGEDAF